MNLRKLSIDLFLYGINSVKPENLIPEKISLKNSHLQIEGDKYPLKKGIYVYGSGKASVEMAKALEEILLDYITDGTVVCNYTQKLKKIKVIEGSHPVPDEKSLKAGETLLKEISSLKEDDFFVYLLSGGSSALIEKPIPPITLKDLQITTQILLKHSVPIEEINIIRKHLSMIKGGRLGHSTKAKGIVLVISDVIGDDLFTIGSAPLYYDPSTYKDAYTILKKHNIFDDLPQNVKKVIEKGIKGEIKETPKKENPNIKHYIIGSNIDALKKIKEKAEKNIKTYIMTSQLKGEAREVAKAVVSIGKEVKRSSNPFDPPVCLLFGGETTVTVKGNGKGGRNQELCLSALIEIKDTKNIVLLSGGTDGIDGNSEDAGAVIDSSSYEKAKKMGLDPYKYLENNDSNSFFTKIGDSIKTGYTGTNVMDITIMVIGG